MSKHHKSVSTEIAHMVHEVRQNQDNPEVLLNIHGIEIDPNTSTVYDTFERKTFDNIKDWASFIVERDSVEDTVYENVGRKHKFDDDE